MTSQHNIISTDNSPIISEKAAFNPEQVVLSIMLGTNKYTGEIIKLVKPEYFQYIEFREIFILCKQAYLSIDKVIELKAFKDYKKYYDLIYTLQYNYLTGANYEYYCKLLKKQYEERILKEANLKLQTAGSLQDYQAITKELNFKLNEESTEIIELDDNVISGLMSDYFNGFDSIKTGYFDLDYLTNGFFNGESIILAGASSMGKSATAINFAYNIAKAGKNSLYISLEMKAQQIINRLICIESGLMASKIRSRSLTDEEQELYASAYTNKIKKLPLSFIDKPNMNIEDIKFHAINHKRNKGLDFLVIDYLGLIKPVKSGISKYIEVSDISREIKLLASELDVPVLTLCQLSRSPSTRPNKRPILSDLRDSGSIEQDADIVMFCYRDEYYNPETQSKGIIEVSVHKHRNGSVGVSSLCFNKNTQKISNRSY